MKKLGFIVLPLMAISFLACNKGGGYTFTFNCSNCKVLNAEGKEITTDISVPENSKTLYAKFYLKGTAEYHNPLESSISVKNGEETIPFEYFPKTGEIIIPVVGNLSIAAQGINKTLEECTWAEINEISMTGRAKEFFDIYDSAKPELNCKKVNLIENGTPQSFPHTVRIIGFNHDDLADGSGKAGITFEFADVITKGIDAPTDTFMTVWDKYDHNFDYRESALNKALNSKAAEIDSVINRFPDNLREVIKPVNKKVGVSINEYNEYEALSFEEDRCPYLFSLAYNEIHNPDGEAVTPGETNGIYEYYKNHGSDEDADKSYRVKKAVNGADGELYWLRSPNTSDITVAYHIHDDGTLCDWSDVTFYSRAVAPAFCI
ncbi:MAG: DUF6273 domain-containing protein [Bacilli bacterium]|nr:DUF6273 domain-containing protein [Bacilli bacterium]